MSSHHSQKTIKLHHDQVNAGRARRVQRQIDRTFKYLAGREEARMEYRYMQGFGFLCFAYTMLATAIYLGWIL